MPAHLSTADSVGLNLGRMVSLVPSEPWHTMVYDAVQVVVMGRDLTKPEDNDLSPLISSGHIITHGQNTPWKDFLRYIESSR